MNTFTASQELSSRSIGDHNCVFTGTVIKRTAKTVTIKTPLYGEKRCKIHVDENGNEFAFPHGMFSMAPIFRAPS